MPERVHEANNLNCQNVLADVVADFKDSVIGSARLCVFEGQEQWRRLGAENSAFFCVDERKTIENVTKGYLPYRNPLTVRRGSSGTTKVAGHSCSRRTCCKYVVAAFIGLVQRKSQHRMLIKLLKCTSELCVCPMQSGVVSRTRRAVRGSSFSGSSHSLANTPPAQMHIAGPPK